jgi:hypothetical protein
MSKNDGSNIRKINPVVVIPHYKRALNRNERLSFDQACRIFSTYPICIIKPGSIPKLDGINETNKNVQFVDLHDKYFASVQTYSNLLVSLEFYKKFKKYSHILIYQLDAYVFRDELTFWCGKDFDYIGAVWFEGWGRSASAQRIIGVGNGGFSLRRTRTCIRIMRRLEILRRITRSVSWLIPESKIQTAGRYYFQFLKYLRLFRIKDLTSLGTLLTPPKSFSEDIFWSISIANSFTDFKVAAPEDAIKFSFEGHPRYLYKLNNEQLPFGCHAFQAYEPDFWEEHINT